MRERFLTTCFLGSLLAGLFLFNILNAQQVGQSFDDTNVKDPTYKSNQSQVVWYDGFWWGAFKKSGGATYLYKYSNGSWAEHVDTGIGSGEAVDIHMDETNEKLYVLVSSSKWLSRLSYSAGSFTKDTGFPITLTIDPAPGNQADDPACITQAQNGDIFIFWVGGSNLLGLRSTTGGVTWSSPFTIAATVATSALSDAISFQYTDITTDNYVGVFVGESHSEFSFFRLKDGDPTSAWVEESLPINPESDDHANIVKDADNNLYMIGKTGGGSADFYLFKRDKTGIWSSYSIDLSPSAGTRPALAIDETYNKLVIFASIPGLTPRRIEYTVLDKDNLTDINGVESWIPVLENGSEDFNDVTVSYQILNNTTNMMVCATNKSHGEVWYNLLISDDALPVFMAFFNASSTVDRINLDWATHSEVNNWQWIVYRREGEAGDFNEITRLPGAGNTNTITYYHYSDKYVEPEKTYYYRLASVDFDGTIHYQPDVVNATVPSSVATFALYPNYPNPFNSQTTIRFEIGETANTVVDIFDISGRRVRRLVDEEMNPGIYTYTWNGKDEHHNDVASGAYIVTLSSGRYFRAIRIILSR